MRIHPREQLLNQAGLDIFRAVSDVFNKRDLTYPQAIKALVRAQEHFLQEMVVQEGAACPATPSCEKEDQVDDFSTMVREICAALEPHGLTHGEILRNLNEHAASMIKYVIREERHPGHPEMPGGLAAD